jgi:hypothetical protein
MFAKDGANILPIGGIGCGGERRNHHKGRKERQENTKHRNRRILARHLFTLEIFFALFAPLR